MKAKVIISFVVLLMSAYCIWSHTRIKGLKTEVSRQRTNISALTTDIERYKAFGDSIEVASAMQLELTKREFEKLYAVQNAKIEELQNIKRPTEYIEVEVMVKDTICIPVYTESGVKRFDYSDQWIDMHGEVSDSAANISYSYTDNITIVNHEKRKRFLGFLWYTKKVEIVKTDVFTDNPNGKIGRIESVKVKN